MKPFLLKGKQALAGLFLFFSISPVFAQLLWTGSPNADSRDTAVTFYDIQRDFNSYWQGKNITNSLPKNERAGWMQFKRWEWFWEPRVYPTGKFPNPMQLYLERQKWYVKHKLDKKKEKLQAAGDWTSAGPTSSTGGYAGLGRINAIMEDPNYNGSSNKTIYIGSASGGLWKTTDDGTNWSALTDNIDALGVTGICINPSNTSIIYIATGDGDHSDTYSVGVLKSTDGGSTWNTTGLNWTTSQAQTIKKLIMNPNDPTELYAATTNGIYKTTNSGSTWSQKVSGNFRDLDFQPGNPKCLYATDYYSVYRTTDGGSNWNELTNGLPESGANFYNIQVAVSSNDTNYVYALYGYYNFSGGNSDNNYGFYGIYRSTDRGANWTAMYTFDSDGKNLMGWESDGSDLGGQAWYDLDIAVSHTDKNTLYVGGVNTWKSTNGGGAWACVAHWYGQNGLPAVHADHHCLWMVPGSSKLYDGNDGGAYRTTNGGTDWTWLGSGLNITQFYKIGVSQLSTGTLIGGAQDNGTKLNKWSGWTDVIGGDGMDCMIDRSDSTVMYGELYYGDMQRSTNNGATWSDLTDPSEGGNWVTPMAMNYQKTGTIYSARTNIWKSTNKGSNWTKISNFSSNAFNFMAVAESDSNYIYAGTGTALTRTTNGGSSWNTLTRPTTSASMSNILINPTNPDKIWVTCSGYSSGKKVYYSTDGGSNWTNISGSLPNVPANTIVYQKNNANCLYVGTDIGVFYRDDNTSDWQDFNSNLPNVVISDLEIQESTNKLYAGTFGRGVWYATMTSAADTVASPVLLSPAHQSTDIALDTVLKWSKVQGATSYEVILDDNSNFGSPLFNTTGLTDTTLSLSGKGLTNSTLYYWKARAKKDTATSSWSSTFYFTTIPQAPSAPTLSYPSDNATSIALNDTLKWNAVANVDSYNVQISTQSNFSSLTVNATGITQVNYLLANASLSNSTTYYWRVQSKKGSQTGSWSSRSFTTIEAAPAAPALSYPSDNATSIALNDTLKWNAVANVDSYNVQISIQSNFSSLIINTTGITQVNYLLANASLSNSTKYYWRVQSKKGSQTSSWSSSRSFTTIEPPPSAPSLSYPSDNAMDVMLNDTLKWNAVANVDSYNVQISTQSNFSNLITNATGITQVNYLLANASLSNSTKYYWRVQSKKGSQTSSWSLSRSFTTIEPPPSAPALALPLDNATEIALTDSLKWSMVNGADSYDFQLSLTSDFATNFYLGTGLQITQVSISVTSAQLATKYYWRARSKKGLQYSVWSSVRNFTTIVPPNPPTLALPLNKATNVSLTSNLTWFLVSGVDSYRVQIASDTTMLNVVKDSAGISGTQYNLAGASLSGNTKYFWRARSKKGSIEGNWSGIRSFTTENNGAGTPNLVSPSDNATNVLSTEKIIWSTASNSDSYDMQVARDLQFSNIVASVSASTDTTALISSLSLSVGTKYYWRARGINNGTPGNWSSVRNFTTSSGVPNTWVIDSSSGRSAVVQAPSSITLTVGARSIQNGDAIGLFFSASGTKKCAGFGIWNSSNMNIKIWGDDPATADVKEGYQTGDTLKYELFDHLTGYTYAGIAAYTSGPDTFQKDSTSVLASLNSKSDATQAIPLKIGWNLISSNIIAENLSIDTIMKDVKSHVVLMKNIKGKNYIPSFNINAIGNWNLQEGYQLFTTAKDTLKLAGYAISAESVPIVIDYGWRFVAYLRHSPMNIATAMTNITDRGSLVLAKSISGGNYIPSFNINTIGNMQPGSAYQIFLNKADTLVYPADDFAKTVPAENWENHAPRVLLPEATQTGNSSTIVIELPNIPDGYEVGAKSESGLLIGSGSVYNGLVAITIWGDNSATNDKDGAANGDYLTFLICNPEKRTVREFTLNNITDMLSREHLQNIKYTQDKFISAKSDIAPADISVFDAKFTPNPASDKADFTFNMPSASHAKISIYTIGGKLAGTVFQGDLPGGLNTIPVNVNNYSAGAYIITCECGEQFEGTVFTIVK